MISIAKNVDLYYVHLLAFEYELMQLAALFNYDQHSRPLLCLLYQLKVLL